MPSTGIGNDRPESVSPRDLIEAKRLPALACTLASVNDEGGYPGGRSLFVVWIVITFAVEFFMPKSVWGKFCVGDSVEAIRLVARGFALPFSCGCCWLVEILLETGESFVDLFGTATKIGNSIRK